MKDETKEILDNIKIVIDEGHYRATCDINYEDCKILLDYITNLQLKIDKAIEYIKNFNEPMEFFDTEELLDILKESEINK